MAKQERLILLRFRPMWKHIDGIREFAGLFTRTTFDDPNLGERVAIAIHELIENAVKYSSDSDDAELEISMHHDGQRIELSVANTPSDGSVEKLRAAIARASTGTSEEAYVSAMRHAVTLAPGQSGLGLARVRHEARLELKLEIEGKLVRVSAGGDRDEPA